MVIFVSMMAIFAFIKAIFVSMMLIFKTIMVIMNPKLTVRLLIVENFEFNILVCKPMASVIKI